MLSEAAGFVNRHNKQQRSGIFVLLELFNILYYLLILYSIIFYILKRVVCLNYNDPGDRRIEWRQEKGGLI